MSDAELAAILIAPRGASGPVRAFMDRLASVGVTVTTVDELAAAVELSHRHGSPPTLLVDLRELSAGDGDAVRLATDAIRGVIQAMPDALPVAVTDKAGPGMVLACLRAGAGDVIDLQLEGTASARVVVHRICERQRARQTELAMIGEQRSMIEDLLKDLIRTERRSIDAEEALAQRSRTGETAAAFSPESRAPAVLLVEYERSVADELADLLESAGVATFAYVTGEEALREAATLSVTTGLDLALVAAQLPGIDGLETVRRLRAAIPGLPAFLMTSVHDADLAAHAADLGVVGFVQKPLPDVHEVAQRLAQLARESLQRTREHVYLQRIKERHERVLARYRSLPREA